MDQEQLLLVKVAEEAGEVATEAAVIAGNLGKMALKAAQFGMHESCPEIPASNAERMHAELDDLMGCIEILNDRAGLGYVPNRDRIEAKKVKVDYYASYSIQLGRVTV